MSHEIERIIRNLNLEPHPEGGWYRQTWKSGRSVDATELARRPGPRAMGTSIAFLLSDSNFSAFHRIASDEIWYFHEGDPLEILVIDSEDELKSLTLGPAGSGFQPQQIVNAGSWFASRLLKPGHWSLVGCAVIPGFDFSDFELAPRSELLQAYPQHREIILELTR